MHTTPPSIAPSTTQGSILSDEELETLLKHHTYSSIQIYGENQEYKLKEVRAVEQGLEVGFKYSLNHHELAACYGPDGVITNHIFSSKKKRDWSENKTERGLVSILGGSSSLGTVTFLTAVPTKAIFVRYVHCIISFPSAPQKWSSVPQLHGRIKVNSFIADDPPLFSCSL